MAISRMQEPRQLMNNGGILTLEDAKRESAGYLDCPESKDTIRINKVSRI